jgi:Cys-tRNA(Pro)/Cys-tRNA(Cys) deacylase
MSPGLDELLRARRATFAIHRHPSVVTFEHAREALPFDVRCMVKGIAFRLPDGRYVIVAMPAERRADYKKISDAMGVRRQDLRAATPEELSSDLDMDVGGVAPFPVNGATVLLDDGIIGLGVIFCGSGRSDATLEIAEADLLRAAAGRLGSFAKTG